jgi:AraC family transcriptional regulator of adaptative response/methylated-DNA-[protein]-cysteine methyltransferase
MVPLSDTMTTRTNLAKREGAREMRRSAGADLFWRAVLARDARFDGAFFFAVRSTRVYCRPSCPSRRPLRSNVLFFPCGEEAERAGYRACKRCQPAAPAQRDARAEMVMQACRKIEEAPSAPPPLAQLAAALNISPFHLQRTFKRVLGISPREFADACRLAQFKAEVREGESVTSAMYGAGYGSSSRLYERADAQLGMTPATYRSGGRGMRLAYTIVACPLGKLLVAATQRGVCAVCLGDSDTKLAAALREEYPAAEITEKNGQLSRWTKQIVQHLEGALPHLDLPVDIRATAFQWRVWRELRRIPQGTTRSYSEIARRIGRPRAVRAVARACATNPVAIVIPCHRVVRADRSMGGYRWGTARKEALLAREGAVGRSNSVSRAEAGR